MTHAQRCNEILDMLICSSEARARWEAIIERRRRKRAASAASRGEAVRQQIIAMRHAGAGMKKIAEAVRCDKRFVRRVLDAAGVA